MRLPEWIRRMQRKRPGSAQAPPEPTPDQVLRTILTSRRKVAELPRLTLGEYRAYLAQTPQPTSDQLMAFAAYASEAKSWYKHLPLWPPGEPFYLFLDPCAGLDRIIDGAGGATYLRRTDTTPQFHHTWMTTDDYRARYGRLAFACSAGSQLLLPISVSLPEDGREVSGLLDNNRSRATIHLAEKLEFQLPDEVLDAGMVRITAAIHPLASRAWVWLRSNDDDAQQVTWPADSGGATTAARIMERSRTIAAQATASSSPESRRRLDEVDADLDALVAPQRQRLRQAMIRAMQAVTALVYGQAV